MFCCTIRDAVILTVVVIGGCNSNQPQPAGNYAPSPKNFVQKLQGKWIATEGESRGKSVEGGAAKKWLRQYTLTFQGQTFVAESPRAPDDTRTPEFKVKRGTFEIDTARVPAGIVFRHDGGSAAGILEFRGERLCICVSAVDDPAPTGFTTSRQNSALLTVYERSQEDE